MQRTVLGLTVLLVASSVEARHADADFRVCNATSFRINAAFGYKEGQNGWVSQGWWIVDPGICRALINGRLTKRHFYVYGEGTGAYSNVRFRGNTPFCIQAKKFKLYQSQFGNDEKADCAAAGLTSARFLEADTQGAANHDFRLTYSGGAQAAGPTFTPPPTGFRPAPSYAPNPPPYRAPTPTPAGGNAGTACQRFPNLC